MLPALEDLPDPGIKRVSPALAGGFFTTEPSGKLHDIDWQKSKLISEN